jgi:hypothetical protein
MKTVEEQFAQVKRAFPEATLTAMGAGMFLVKIPGVSLPEGWSQPIAEVLFVVPNGFPNAAPDCFWTDPTLRLQTGAMPQNAQIGQQNSAQQDPNKLWFSWHVHGAWNPTRCDLMTYVNIIRRRFEAVQ